jgi:CRP-like cAMP-binding protein
MLSSVKRLLFVRGVPIFKELRDDFLIRLASIMSELSFPANHTIFTQGEEGRSLYIVISGQVRVHIRDNDLAQLEAGACFGEMALFDAEPRSASVTTIEPCDCLVLTQQQLYEAIDETPGIAVNVIAMLSRRIRELNQKLSAAEKQLHQAASHTAQPPDQPQDWQQDDAAATADLSDGNRTETNSPRTDVSEQFSEDRRINNGLSDDVIESNGSFSNQSDNQRSRPIF